MLKKLALTKWTLTKLKLKKFALTKLAFIGIVVLLMMIATTTLLCYKTKFRHKNVNVVENISMNEIQNVETENSEVIWLNGEGWYNIPLE